MAHYKIYFMFIRVSYIYIYIYIYAFSRCFYPKRLSVLTFMVSSLDINGCVELFWGDSKCTLLYKLYTQYFTL